MGHRVAPTPGNTAKHCSDAQCLSQAVHEAAGSRLRQHPIDASIDSPEKRAQLHFAVAGARAFCGEALGRGVVGRLLSRKLL